MTLFEYLAIGFGLVFSMAAMRLIGGLPYAIDPRRRYWVHLIFVLMWLFGLAAVFWTFWSLREIEWTFGRFLLTLSLPGVMYFAATLLVPENPEEVESWRDHFVTIRSRLFLALACWMLLATIGASVNLGLSLLHPIRAFHATIITIGIVGAVSESPRVHAALVLLLLVFGLALAFTFAAAPGWLAE